MKTIDQEKLVNSLMAIKVGIEGVIDVLNASEPQVPESGTPWIDEARKYEGMDEDDDNSVLQGLLGVDPEMTPWCAAFANAVVESCGIKGTGSLRARDFADWGAECECKDGAVAVFKKHVGFVVKDGEKLLGGNQGNMVKESNLAWYHKNMEFLGYRWPVA